MRILLLTLVAAFQASATITSIAISPAAQCTPGQSNVTTSAINTTGATLLTLVIVGSGGLDPTAFAVSDQISGGGSGNQWNFITKQQTSTVVEVIAYSYRKTSGAALGTGSSHTFVVGSVSASAISLVAAAWGGTVTGSNPLDRQSGANNGGAVSSLMTGSITPTESGELVLAGCGLRSSTAYTSSPLAANAQANWVSGTYTGILMAHRIQTTAEAVNNTCGMAAPGQIAASIASFKAADGAPAGTAAPPRRRITQ